jgi:esterase/lipase
MSLTICSALDQAGIPYYAPLLTGHGLDDLHLFSAVQPSDWLRDAVMAYDQLASLLRSDARLDGIRACRPLPLGDRCHRAPIP